ncbi:DivIVA domain-containing protein [Cumulibacter manganitolerans]|uniref:DivIVA domain-containing protein n=1 Tax=Cumulibacter manganitolerans TaxID=1884992 RepID=UPI001294E6DC|nr:DivIVA domain-containing protein [Cumulibacter manganitolerans]
MPLTPADVHNVAFKKPPIGKRGYDDEEVDAFLDLVEAEFARLIEENADLRSQVADLEGQLAGRPSSAENVSSGSGHYSVLAENAGQDEAPAEAQPEPEPTVQAAPEPQPEPAKPASAMDEHIQASRILALATETADRHVNEAKEKAEKELAEAQAKAEELRTTARREHDDTINGAKSEAERHLTEVRTNAAALLSDSQSKAAATEKAAQERAQELTAAAERKQADILRALDERKSVLERRIEGLRDFEAAYRTRMHGYLTNQLKEIDELPPIAPDGSEQTGNGPASQVSGFVGSSDNR